MGTLQIFRWWIYAACFAVIYLTGETDSAARFLGHVPREDYQPETMDRDLPDYDSDVKIPGRHYPKLPYQNPYLENEQDNFHTPHHSHHTHHHTSNYNHHHNGDQNHNHHQNSHHNNHHHQPVTPVMAYGVRRDPSGSTFSRQSHFPNFDSNFNREEPADYLDDTRAVAADGAGGHRLAVPYGGKLGPPSTTPHPASPSFDRNTARSLTVQSGKTAKLVCRVLNVGDKSVSWMRHEDLHILTVDKYKYSTDKRLSVIFNEADQEWILQIQSVRQEDSGLYECQVSTKPVLSFIVSMNVVVPSARILNGPEIFVHRGSPINLSCVVDHTVERPSYIYWYHYNKMIDYDKEGDTIKLDKSGPNTISNLLVRSASPSDSGKYTCRPSNGEDASVMLHVLNGENQAAMQTNTSDRLMTSLATILGVISVGISAVIVLCRC
ncbi:uncharacterized protein [Macrobrachium rosenbergii]|uniref:uncharacterized protein isoform X2 n=1 Tax=Macrobrachium rosenbergii TaxID=79674 RepID=UPI0034D5C0F3